MTEQSTLKNLRLSGANPYQQRYRSIQVLRALAALSVLLFHEKVLPVGYVGVDIFFIISGFVMGTVGIDERPMAFVGKRLVRIVPLYWLVTLFMCALSLVPGAFKTFKFDFQTLGHSLLFIPYVDQTGHVWPLVVAGWTLNYEMFFYLIFALGLAIARPRVVPMLLMIALVAVGLLVNPGGPGPQTYTDSLLLEFVLGLALSQTNIPPGLWAGMAVFGAGLGLFALANVIGAPEYGLARVIWLGGAAFALVLGGVMLERGGHWPGMKPLELVGDASYSLYLVHGIVIAFAGKFIHLPAIATHLLVLVISLAVALMSYRLFERPVARLLRRTSLLVAGKAASGGGGASRHWNKPVIR